MSALRDALSLTSAADQPRRRRVTSLRTRSFGVIAVTVIIPCLLLSALGVYAYYRSWNNSARLNIDSAYSSANLLTEEVSSLATIPVRVTAGDRAALVSAIVYAFADGHVSGAEQVNVSDVPTMGLPEWVALALKRQGFAIGSMQGPGGDPHNAEVVAWRVGPSLVHVYSPNNLTGYSTASSPLSPRLVRYALIGAGLVVVLVLLGGVAISRSVVLPVRRVAEASRRLAEGRGGEPVPPAGPREIRELANAFNDMDAKLAKAQEAEQAFLLSVSHELKTPLTSIRGYAEGLSDGALPAAEAAAVIGAESSRLERLVGDLLDLARMRKSAFTVRHEPVDLAAAAAEVGGRYEATAREAGLTLAVQSREASFAVGDHDRVVQVVSNLVENAIRSTPADGTVSITAAPGRVAVADTGLGLTSDDLPRAFERFYLYSRHRADRRVGTGLGLAIVKELTEAMGGGVTVTSTVGVGTTFVVSLPQVVAGAPPAGDADEPLNGEADEPTPGESDESIEVDACDASECVDDDLDATEALVPVAIHVIDLEAPSGVGRAGGEGDDQ